MTPQKKHRFPGFTPVDFLIGAAVAGILGTLTLPAFPTAGRAALDTGVERVMNHLAFARTEAMERHTTVQLRIVVEDLADPAAAGRVLSIFAKEADEEGGYQQLTPWHRLPDGVSMLKNASASVANIPGKAPVWSGTDILADATGGNLEMVPFQGRQVRVRVVEFDPFGHVLRLPNTTEPHSIFLLASTVSSSPSPALDGTVTPEIRKDAVKNKTNWRQIRLSSRTGMACVQAAGTF